MKLVLRLTSSIFRRWDFWLAVGLYAYFLCMPLYSEYQRGGGMPALYFLNRTYRATDARSILQVIALFPVIRTFFYQLDSSYLSLWLVRKSSWRSLAILVAEALLMTGVVVGLGYILSLAFIACFVPIASTDGRILSQLVTQYPGAHLLGSPWVGFYYLIPYFLQWATTSCTLLVVMGLAMFTDNILFLTISPLLFYALFRMKLVWYMVNPLHIFAPEITALKGMYNNQLLPVLAHQLVYLILYILLAYYLLHRALKKRIIGRYQFAI